jgi:DNA polymerase-3 subunit gamma/tau
MSVVLANKYRPKKLADLIGQDSVVRILTNTILSGKPHHAYIFSGKFGCGKTSSARIFAASVNGKDGMTLTPDMEDPDIQAIFEGKSIDVKEIDAASNRSIDDIRALREEIRYSTVKLNYRFVIIDEAHRLTGDAAEAALKMIEEPPKNVIFILCTTNAEDLKDTIHSRCMPLRFNKVSWDQLYSNLVKIAKSENIEYEDAALRVAAKLSKGSVRNSLQNLQTMLTFSGGNKITGELAQQSLSAVDDNKYFDLVDMILRPDAGEAMRIIDQILGDGREVGEVLDGLVGHIRTLLVIKTAKDTSKLLFLTDEEKKRFVAQSQTVGIELLLQMIDLVAEVNKGMALNLNPQTLLEKLVICSIIFNRRTAAATA